MWKDEKIDLYQKIVHNDLTVGQLDEVSTQEAAEAYCFQNQIAWGQQPDKSNFIFDRAMQFPKNHIPYSAFSAWMDWELLKFRRATR